MPAITHRRLQEALIVALLFASASVWGTVYWNRSFQAGRQPHFYQLYFEPAILFSCGRGFLLTHPTLPAIRSFLDQKIDRLPCDQIPPTTGISEYGVFQKSWYYLMLSVGITWKLLGVSWSGMGPLFGVLFGATIVAAYGIFRVSLSRIIAVAGAGALAVSAIHLQHLPHLRDYAKAPFTLGLIWLLCLMVVGAPTWRRLLALAAAYGVLLGVGYGFRTDFLVEIPIFVVVVFAFTGGGWLRNLPSKLAATALCFALFAAVAWPVITAVRRDGGCQWHAALLGLTDEFNDSLMVNAGPYSFGQTYSDDLVYGAATAYEQRMHPGVGHIEYCSPAYDQVTLRYLTTLGTTFPGDLETRTLASMQQVAHVAFRWLDQPLPGFATFLFRVRNIALRPFRGTGIIFVVAALGGLLAASWRIGLFATLMFCYFTGYPMLQFGIRHYFHLEFITWWAIGFCAQHAIVRIWPSATRVIQIPPQQRVTSMNWTRSALVFSAVAICAVASLWTLRRYQQRVVTGLFEKYMDAPREQIALSDPAGLVRIPSRYPLDRDPFPVDVLELDVAEAGCSADSTVFVRYEPPMDNLSHRLRIGGAAGAGGVTRFFEPLYTRFEGLEFRDVSPGCVRGVYRMTSPERLPILLGAKLEPGWEGRPLYMRFSSWKWTAP